MNSIINPLFVNSNPMPLLEPKKGNGEGPLTKDKLKLGKDDFRLRVPEDEFGEIVFVEPEAGECFNEIQVNEFRG